MLGVDVENVMSRNKLDICFLQETWLKKKHKQCHGMVVLTHSLSIYNRTCRNRIKGARSSVRDRR